MKFLQTLSSFITALIRKIVNQEYVMDHKVLLEFVQSGILLVASPSFLCVFF